MKSPRVLALVGDENGCSLWRVFQPYSALERCGYGAWFRHKDDPETYKPEFAYLATTRLEAIVVARMSWREQYAAQQWIRSLHNAGLAVIYELDDDVLSPQINARQQATTELNKTLEDLEQDRRDRIAAIRLCDGVTVSNERLGVVARQYVGPNIPVVTVPNRIDVRWFRSTLRGAKRSIPPLTIGWAGGARYAEDFSQLAEAWSNIARRYPHVAFVIQGYMADVLVQAVPAAQVHRLPWLPITEYPRALRNIDIGCASVAPNHFNECKTPIKLWEYTLAGAATVVSDTLYGPVARDGVDSLVCETAAEWEAALARLVEDSELRRLLYRAQRRRIAEQHSLEHNVLEWPRAWQTIIDAYKSRQPATRLALAG